MVSHHKNNSELIKLLRDEDGTGKIVVVDVAAEFFAVVGENLMKFALIHKYGSNRKDFLEGITNNFYSECFKCGLNLGAMYNIIICYKCNLFADGYHQYPLICHNCCKKKLKRGEMKYTFCDICNHPVTHLGITPFS